MTRRTIQDYMHYDKENYLLMFLIQDIWSYEEELNYREISADGFCSEHWERCMSTPGPPATCATG